MNIRFVSSLQNRSKQNLFNRSGPASTGYHTALNVDMPTQDAHAPPLQAKYHNPNSLARTWPTRHALNLEAECLLQMPHLAVLLLVPTLIKARPLSMGGHEWHSNKPTYRSTILGTSQQQKEGRRTQR